MNKELKAWKEYGDSVGCWYEDMEFVRHAFLAGLNWKGELKDKISEKEAILLYLNDLKGFYVQLCRDVPDELNSLISRLTVAEWPKKSEVDELVSDMEEPKEVCPDCKKCGHFGSKNPVSKMYCETCGTGGNFTPIVTAESRDKSCNDCGTLSLCKAMRKELILCESFSGDGNKETEIREGL